MLVCDPGPHIADDAPPPPHTLCHAQARARARGGRPQKNEAKDKTKKTIDTRKRTPKATRRNIADKHIQKWLIHSRVPPSLTVRGRLLCGCAVSANLAGKRQQPHHTTWEEGVTARVVFLTELDPFQVLAVAVQRLQKHGPAVNHLAVVEPQIAHLPNELGLCSEQSTLRAKPGAPS